MDSCIHWFIALIFICECYAVDRGIIILRLYRWPVRACIIIYDKGFFVRRGYRCLLSHSFFDGDDSELVTSMFVVRGLGFLGGGFDC